MKKFTKFYDDEGPSCPKCGLEMTVLDSGEREGFWWFKAECSCGFVINDDNFDLLDPKTGKMTEF